MKRDRNNSNKSSRANSKTSKILALVQEVHEALRNETIVGAADKRVQIDAQVETTTKRNVEETGTRMIVVVLEEEETVETAEL
jgi:hypothetical protein